MGGLGIRDFREFNIAKYYPRTNFLNASRAFRSSYAWQSILAAQSLLKQGIVWGIGNGKNIQIWQDNWIIDSHPRPPRLLQQTINPSITVSELFVAGSKSWDCRKLQQFVQPQDIPLITQLRPPTVEVSDSVSWFYSKTGSYTVKSGYHLQSQRFSAQSISSSPLLDESIRAMFKKLWKSSLPPKIKTFWWKVIHQRLPVTTQLNHRGSHLHPMCWTCREAIETITHLLFQCRVAKEVWELAPIITPPGDILETNDLHQNLQVFFQQMPAKQTEISLFPFIGWSLWKARNNLVFKNRCLIDFSDTTGRNCVDSTKQIWNEHCTRGIFHSFSILTNGSGNDRSSHGCSRVNQAKYQEVLFVGDCKILYDAMQDFTSSRSQEWRPLIIQGEIKDLDRYCQINKGYKFMYIPRRLLCNVDARAKLARSVCKLYTIRFALDM